MIYEYYAASVLLIATGILCVVLRSNLIKKVMGLGILGNGIHLLLITAGYRENSIAPIVSLKNIGIFKGLSVDPLPQALVLTSIVIDLSVITLALMIVVWIFRKFHTIDARELKNLRG